MRLDQFIFCEQARPEPSGQFTLIGMIPGDTLGLAGGDDATEAFSLPMLTCFIVLDYMQGATELETQFEVTCGTEIIQRTPRHRDRRENTRARFHSQVFTFSPFLGPRAGDYVFKFIVDANGRVASFSRKLTIERSAARPITTTTH